MPPNPPSNAHGFAMRSMSLRDMQIPKSEKKNSWPPPSQILGTPLISPPLHPRKLQPPPALAPPPPPLSDIKNANSNAFEQLHKYQQCKKCKHLPPISPLSFFHFSSKNNIYVWGEWVLNLSTHSPHSHYIICPCDIERSKFIMLISQ